MEVAGESTVPATPFAEVAAPEVMNGSSASLRIKEVHLSQWPAERQPAQFFHRVAAPILKRRATATYI